MARIVQSTSQFYFNWPTWSFGILRKDFKWGRSDRSFWNIMKIFAKSLWALSFKIWMLTNPYNIHEILKNFKILNEDFQRFKLKDIFIQTQNKLKLNISWNHTFLVIIRSKLAQSIPNIFQQPIWFASNKCHRHCNMRNNWLR